MKVKQNAAHPLNIIKAAITATPDVAQSYQNGLGAFGKYSAKVELEGACERLTSKNCKTSSCCVFVNGNKCSAGDASGPTYKTDENGKPIAIDNFYYQNKCHGSGCQK